MSTNCPYYPPTSVTLPVNEEQAAAMILLGEAWLREHAPHRLKKPTEQKAETFDKPLELLDDLLTKDELLFVKAVHGNPGCKLNSMATTHWDGNKPIHLWTNPERLGLVKSVGSYKWWPTERLVLAARPAYSDQKTPLGG